MSDDIYDKLVEATHRIKAEAWEEGFKVGSGADTHATMVILTELINGLSAIHYPHPTENPDDYPCCCKECHEKWPCSVEQLRSTAANGMWEINEKAVEMKKGNQ